MGKEKLYTSGLNSYYSNKNFFRKSDLRDFYRSYYENLDEKAFRRILYALTKNKIIIKIDPGTYILNNNEEHPPTRKQYIPAFSPELISISDSIRIAFPYTEKLIWETRILYNFMLHQPKQNVIILETEKEAVESIFNFLGNQFPGNVFLDPNEDIVMRYVFRNEASIIVSSMISRSPRHRVNGIPCPKLEKILVDIFADKGTFFIFQGQELVNIYENAFNDYQVSETKLFWYAKRRKIYQKIKAFMTQKTNIQLIQQ